MPLGNPANREYRALAHPARRRIVELLGSHESMAFSELREETGLPVGTLYYHLDVLQGLVVQDDGRRYLLSKDGLKLYSALAAREGLPVPKTFRPAGLLPGWLFSLVGDRTPLALASWMLVAAMGGALSLWAGQALILFHWGVSIFPNVVDVALFPVTMFLYALYNFAAAKVLTGHRSSVGVFFASGLVFVPYFVFPSVVLLAGGVTFGSLKAALVVLAIVLQGLSLALGAAYVSSTYGVRLERSLLVQLVFYVIATLVFSSLQAFGFVTEAWNV